MSPLLIALLGVLLVPRFVSSWRLSLAGLALQGLLTAWIAYRMEGSPASAAAWLTLFDLILIRGVGAPLALYGVLQARRAPPRNDVIPPNLLSWTLALGIVLISFNFSEVLTPEDGDPQTLVAVATAGLLLGFLVLATQSGPASQMIGALRIENSIALFELDGPPHETFWLQLGQVLIVLLTVGLYRWYLAHLPGADGKPVEATVEGPAL